MRGLKTKPSFVRWRFTKFPSVRAESCKNLLREDKYEELGKMMKISHKGDRITRMEKKNADVALEFGLYDCSTE